MDTGKTRYGIEEMENGKWKMEMENMVYHVKISFGALSSYRVLSGTCWQTCATTP